ncbi:hypothetical protein EDC01DRAFT_635832 [Geopyxis carbonaria]|nr:hypothetical protein EDC01DRAFT_635832 [Geopyxis carbonaria]
MCSLVDLPETTSGNFALLVLAPVREFSTESLARATKDASVASPPPEVVLGQIVLLRTSLKLLSFSTFCESAGRDTRKLFGKIVGKVWKLVANPKLPHLYTDPNQEHSRLSLRYVDGFPDDWKQNDDLVKKAIGCFRIYARFWYHIVYETTLGGKLAVHQTELPEDHLKDELEALRQRNQHSLDSPVDNRRCSRASVPPVQPSSRRSSASAPNIPRVEREPSEPAAAAATPLHSRKPSNPTDTPRARSSDRDSTPRQRPEPADGPHHFRIHSVESSIRKPIMPATTFAEKIKSDNILAFNGIPGKVSSLDITVEDVCTEYDYPVYYGGTVQGSILQGYRYVEPGAPGSASNYHFGTRMCSSITGKFVENARMWWEDYRKGGGAKPNCWKRSELNPEVGSTKPASVVEVSLYDLLKLYFPEENDEIEASLELKRFRWNSSHRDNVPFSTFRTYSSSLALRSGYDKWKQRMPLIIQCIEPVVLHNSVRLYDDEHKFWFECRVTVNTWLNAHPVTAPQVIDLTKCEKCGGSHDTEKCRKGAKGPKSTTSLPSSSRVNQGTRKTNACVCEARFCAARCQLRSATVAAALRPLRRQRGHRHSSALFPRSGKPAGGQYKPYTYRTCGGAGHTASVCPTRSTASAATKMVDSSQNHNHKRERDDEQPDSNSALYYMDSWTPKQTDIGLHRHNLAMSLAEDERIDELFSTRYADQLVDFPIFNNITSPTDSIEVIDNVLGKTAKTSVVKVSDAVDMSALGPISEDRPTGPVCTISSTLRGQDMLTIFDTGAVKAAVPLSTANGSRCPWTTKLPHKLSF